jgi:hypothetical protein
MNKDNITKNFIIGTFVLLYILTSCISTIHVIDFFKLSNPDWLATTLAIAFEIGAAASLASIIALKKMNKGIVWGLFFILTLMQAMGNTYYAYTHLANYQSWIELFGLVDNDIIEQKRILSLVSGAILPLVALGFIKSLVDYIKPESETPQVPIPDEIVLVNKNEPAVDIVEPIIEPVVEGVIEPVVEEVIESVVEEPIVEVSEAVAENKVDDPKMNILNKVKVFVNGDLK